MQLPNDHEKKEKKPTNHKQIPQCSISAFLLTPPGFSNSPLGLRQEFSSANGLKLILVLSLEAPKRSSGVVTSLALVIFICTYIQNTY